MNFSILFNQLSGLINLAFMPTMFYVWYPDFISSRLGIILCALAIGTYLFVIHYRATVTQMNQLGFVPTGDCLAQFEKEIVACGLKPEDIRLRYAYTGDSVAMAGMNTVQIDPLLWRGVEHDPSVVSIMQIIDAHILPGVPAEKKALIAQIGAIINPDAQRFIFKHELGHVYYNYSMKKLVVIGLIGFFATVAAMTVALGTIAYIGGFAALVLALLVGGAADWFLVYSSNVMFKAREEKKADLFAARFSTSAEIEAAADFFQQYEKCAKEYHKTSGLVAFIPQEVLSGHPAGSTRAAYLRKLIS